MENHLDILDRYQDLKKVINYGIRKCNVRYKADYKAPSTYKEMVDHYDTYKYYLVYDGGDHGFLGRETNIKFRALHDHMHRTLGLKFTYNDEKQLSDITVELFRTYASELGFSDDVIEDIGILVNAEIKGQIEYHERYGKFVSDQRVFIRNYVLNGEV